MKHIIFYQLDKSIQSRMSHNNNENLEPPKTFQEKQKLYRSNSIKNSNASEKLKLSENQLIRIIEHGPKVEPKQEQNQTQQFENQNQGKQSKSNEQPSKDEHSESQSSQQKKSQSQSQQSDYFEELEKLRKKIICFSVEDFKAQALQLEALFFRLAYLGYPRSPMLSTPPFICYMTYYFIISILENQNQSEDNQLQYLFQTDFKLKNILELLEEQGVNRLLENQIFCQFNKKSEECLPLQLKKIITELNYDMNYNLLLDDFLKYQQVFIKQENQILESFKKTFIRKNNFLIADIRFVFINKQNEELNFLCPIGQFKNIQFMDYNSIDQVTILNQTKKFIKKLPNERHSEKAMIVWLHQDMIKPDSTTLEYLSNKIIDSKQNQLKLIKICIEITSEKKVCQSCVNPIKYLKCTEFHNAIVSYFQQTNLQIQTASGLGLIILSQYFDNPQEFISQEQQQQTISNSCFFLINNQPLQKEQIEDLLNQYDSENEQFQIHNLIEQFVCYEEIGPNGIFSKSMIKNRYSNLNQNSNCIFKTEIDKIKILNTVFVSCDKQTEGSQSAQTHSSILSINQQNQIVQQVQNLNQIEDQQGNNQFADQSIVTQSQDFKTANQQDRKSDKYEGKSVSDNLGIQEIQQIFDDGKDKGKQKQIIEDFTNQIQLEKQQLDQFEVENDRNQLINQNQSFGKTKEHLELKESQQNTQTLQEQIKVKSVDRAQNQHLQVGQKTNRVLLILEQLSQQIIDFEMFHNYDQEVLQKQEQLSIQDSKYHNELIMVALFSKVVSKLNNGVQNLDNYFLKNIFKIRQLFQYLSVFYKSTDGYFKKFLKEIFEKIYGFNSIVSKDFNFNLFLSDLLYLNQNILADKELFKMQTRSNSMHQVDNKLLINILIKQKDTSQIQQYFELNKNQFHNCDCQMLVKELQVFLGKLLELDKIFITFGSITQLSSCCKEFLISSLKQINQKQFVQVSLNFIYFAKNLLEPQEEQEIQQFTDIHKIQKQEFSFQEQSIALFQKQTILKRYASVHLNLFPSFMQMSSDSNINVLDFKCDQFNHQENQ